jgi:hypothetical protein
MRILTAPFLFMLMLLSADAQPGVTVGPNRGGNIVAAGSGVTIVTNGNLVTISASGGSGVTNSDGSFKSYWQTNAADGSITNINSAQGVVSVAGTNAVLMLDNKTTGNWLINGRTNGLGSYLLRSDGSEFFGANVGQDTGLDNFSIRWTYKVAMADSNEPTTTVYSDVAIDNETSYNGANLYWNLNQVTKTADFEIASFGPPGTSRTLEFMAMPTDTLIKGYDWEFHNAGVFKLRGVGYTSPSAHGVAGSVLTDTVNDGTLSWQPGLQSTAGTNEILSLATNVVNQNTLPGFWKTNTVEGGIWYTNADDPKSVAKFSAQQPGTFASGYTNLGGQVMALQNGDVALGIAYNANSVVKADSGPGFAFGAAYTAGIIESIGSSEFVIGEAHTAGVMKGTGSGNLIGGYAEDAGTIYSQAGRGNIVHGATADASSLITAVNTFGSMAMGAAFTASTIKTTGYGSIAHGESDSGTGFGGSMLWANGAGSFASGFSDRAATIKASGDGTHAMGSASKNAQIIANAGLAGGFAISNAVITADTDTVQSDGNFAWGWANGVGSTIYSQGKGALAFGAATNGGGLTATGQVSVTFGENVGNEPVGGYSFAYGKNYTNRTANTFNVGWGSNVFQVTTTGVNVNGSINGGLNATLAANQTTTSATLATTTLSVTLVAGNTYTFQAELFLSDSTAVDGAKIDFNGGTATATTFIAQVTAFDTALNLSSQLAALATGASASTFTGAGAFEVHGTIFVNAGGTFIPRFAQNAHTTGTLTLAKGSFIKFTQTPLKKYPPPPPHFF